MRVSGRIVNPVIPGVHQIYYFNSKSNCGMKLKPRPYLSLDKFHILFNLHMHIFATFLHEMGPQGPTKENAQLNRQNDFSFT